MVLVGGDSKRGVRAVNEVSEEGRAMRSATHLSSENMINLGKMSLKSSRKLKRVRIGGNTVVGTRLLGISEG